MDETMKSLKCVVVGAGPTGSMVTCFLKRIYKDRISLEVWDKSHGIGGRMRTHRYDCDSLLSVDLGAQYISATKEYAVKHASLYEELQVNNILTPLNVTVGGMQGSEDTMHYVAPGGIAAIPKHFLQQSGCTFRPNVKLKEVNITNSSLTACATIMENNDSKDIKHEADIIIITTPIPQLLQLQGDIVNMLSPYKSKLNDVQYSTRYALGLFYLTATETDTGVDWACKYTPDNPCLCFVSMDSKKRERHVSEGLSVTAHASVPWSLQHFDDNFANVEQTMIEHVHNEIPGLPKTADKSLLIRWRYSQVRDSYIGAPGHIVLNDSPLIICAGDGFSHSNFDGSAESALSVVDCFKKCFPLLE